MSKIPHQHYDCALGCPVELSLSIIGGKWKGTILYHLFLKPQMRFNEIRRLLPDISQRTLTAQLRALEKDRLIERTIYPEIPPRVEYRLSTYGKSLEPIIYALKDWGEKHRQKYLQ